MFNKYKSYTPRNKTSWLDVVLGLIGFILGGMFMIVMTALAISAGLFIRFLGLIIAVVVVVLTLQFMGVL